MPSINMYQPSTKIYQESCDDKRFAKPARSLCRTNKLPLLHGNATTAWWRSPHTGKLSSVSNGCSLAVTLHPSEDTNLQSTCCSYAAGIYYG